MSCPRTIRSSSRCRARRSPSSGRSGAGIPRRSAKQPAITASIRYFGMWPSNSAASRAAISLSGVARTVLISCSAFSGRRNRGRRCDRVRSPRHRSRGADQRCWSGPDGGESTCSCPNRCNNSAGSAVITILRGASHKVRRSIGPPASMSSTRSTSHTGRLSPSVAELCACSVGHRNIFDKFASPIQRRPGGLSMIEGYRTTRWSRLLLAASRALPCPVHPPVRRWRMS